MGWYITLGIVVNCLWGLAFLVPNYLTEVDPVTIACGRYIVFGLISLIILACSKSNFRSITKSQWWTAFLFALTGNVGFYIMLSMAIRYAGISISALILGILPVTMMLYGNLIQKEFEYRRLLTPSGFALSGVVMLEIFQHTSLSSQKATEWTVGIFFAMISLIMWTWYGVTNARYLKQHPSISNKTWSLAIGVCCLIQALIGLCLFSIATGKVFSVYLFRPQIAIQYVLGCLILGVFASWLALIGWNNVSRHLPVALSAQLIVFGTISSLVYGYLAKWEFPHVIELGCAIVILLGVIMCIRILLKSSQTEQDVAFLIGK